MAGGVVNSSAAPRRIEHVLHFTPVLAGSMGEGDKAMLLIARLDSSGGEEPNELQSRATLRFLKDDEMDNSVPS